MSTARKTVTILFCDVTGSTALGEELDPESLREVIQRYFTEMRAVIERHGGTVEKFIGDAVMAVFGVPQIHEDDALRAVRTAIDMQSALEALNVDIERGWGTRIQARIGVNTGEVLASDPASGQSFVSGDAVNVAARLEQAAEPGEILLGESTYRLVRAAVIAEPLEPLSVKGKAEPLSAYRLLVVETGAEILPRRFDSPLVGRTKELAAIRDTFEEAVTGSACRLVTVIGHAGVGKSRLTHEAVASLGARARVLRGRCLPYGEGITFWPVAEALREATGLDEATSAEEAEAKIAAVLPTGQDRVLVVDRLAAILGVGGAAGPIQESFWAIRKSFEGLAAEKPLVLVFDDIQWAEPTFLDLVQYLATFASGHPMLLLCLARPELLETRSDWGDTGAVIRLEPLRSEESERLVGNLLGEWSGPEDVGRQIVDGAGGNPLFIEEMLRMLVDDGALAQEDGRWVLRGDRSRIGAPETVHAVIAARLDRLDPADRDVLERASVVGEVFWWGAVADLSTEAQATSVGRSLQALVRKDLIRPDPSTFAGEDGFRFGHLLIRDVAYESLPKKVRADLHARFASWLERRSGERAGEYEEIVGYHAERAHGYLAELGSMDERGTALAALAAERLASAGVRSFDRGDMPSAANLLSRAVALLPAQDLRQLELLQSLAVALEVMGQFEDADGVFERAIEGGRAIGDRRIELRATTRYRFSWMLRSPEATHADALAEMERAIAVFEELDDDAGLAEALRMVGIVRLWAGKCGQALQHWERGVGHARRSGDRRLEIDVLRWMGLALTQGLTPAGEAIDRIQALLRGHEDDPMLRSQMGRHQAELEAMRGRFSEARSLLDQGTEVARQLGLIMELGAGFQRSAGYVAFLAGDLHAAEAALRQGLEALERIGDIGHQVSVAADLALVLLELDGREREVLALADANERLMIEDDVDAQVRWDAARARAVARLGDAAEAERLARRSVDRAWATDYSELQGLSQVALAEVLQGSGQTEEAAEALRKAVAVHEAKGNVVSAAITRQKLEDMEAVAPNPGPTGI
ncbi:MAG TPA: adenylate/guanylate cyclase domain-containing protein [Actinomycetota bacterium]|nr:adenylate/guanylate cyclase domain-containing protein [Actinomycetota bacterium]